MWVELVDSCALNAVIQVFSKAMRLFLAPMEGVVDHHMRDVIRLIGGIDVCVTEFIRVTEHTLPRRVFIQYCPELLPNYTSTTDLRLCPIRIQLLGSNPETLARNARKAAMLGAPAIDLNFGCPAKTVNRNKGGACLLDDTQLIYSIVSKVRSLVPKHVPVTAKIRLGYNDRKTYLDNAIAIADAGASELTVHARSKADAYNAPAYWEYIGEIQRQLTIPVIANGEIWSLEDFKICRDLSGCTDFMLGRGILAKPDLANEIKSYANGNTPEQLQWQQIAQYLHDFFLVTSKAYPAKYTGNRIKQWLHYLSMQYTEAQTVFDSIKKSREFNFIDRQLKSQFL